MGFTPIRRIYTLDFDGTDLDGLEVKACSVSTGSFLEFTELMDAADADMNSMRKLFAAFAEQSLRSWNLEDDNGVPIPATLAGLYTQEIPFVLSVIHAWMAVMSGVGDDLKAPSNDGMSSLVELPMTVLSSENQAS